MRGGLVVFGFVLAFVGEQVVPVQAQQRAADPRSALSRPSYTTPLRTHLLEKRTRARREAGARPVLFAGVDAVAHEQDSLALLALFNATNGAAWTERTGWGAGPVSTWFGVMLNEEGRVTSIELRQNNLAGLLPVELGGLAALENLELPGNFLQGSLPDTLAALTNLKSINLWGNFLTGSIPPALAQLANLEDLLLFDNRLSGTIPPELGTLTMLRRLWLDFNQLEGTIPASLGTLSQLTELFLDVNQLRGPIPPELGALSNVISLFLANNQLTGSMPPSFSALTALENLSLENNALTGPIPEALGQMHTLSTLFLGGNQLTGEIPDALLSLRNLTKLHLNDNNLTGPIPEELGGLFDLRELNLFNNAFTGGIPSSLGNLFILEYLDLGRNQVTGSIPQGIVALQKLERLFLDGNRMTGGLSLLPFLERLQIVSVRGNIMTGSIPPTLGSLLLLEILDLGQNLFDGEIPLSLSEAGPFSRARGLRVLALDNNRLRGAVPVSFSTMPVLETLLLQNNRLDDLPDLSPLTTLQTVSVADNRLTFEDLEPNVGLADGSIRYAPQDTVHTGLEQTATAATFSVSVGGSSNQYQWYRDGVAVDGATATSLSIDAAAETATYHCEITNTIATALTLISQPLLFTPTRTWPGFDAQDIPPGPFAFVQLIHNMPDIGPVDVYVDDEKVLDDFAFQTATPFVPLVRGYRALALVPAETDDNTNPVWADTLLLQPDAYYSALAIGQGAPNTLDVLVLDQIRTAARVGSQVEYLLVHGVPEAVVDIRLLSRGDLVSVEKLLVNNFGFGDVAGYWRLDPAEHIFEVLDAPGTTVLAVERLDLSGYEGQTVTLITSILGDGRMTLLGFDTNGTLITSESVTRAVSSSSALVLDGSHPHALDTAEALSETPPVAFTLYANYPNPFKTRTRIAYDVASAAHVRLTVYDVLGRLVQTIVDQPMPAGRHTAVFEATDLPSGLYVYHIDMGTFKETRTMLLVR